MKELLHTYARYHGWAMDILLKATDGLSDAQLRAEAGLYFTSVHGTLNHLLLCDRLYRGRLIGQPYRVTSLSAIVEDDRGRLAAALRTETAAWEDIVDSFTEEALASPYTYTNVRGLHTTVKLGDCFLHYFNHATHHRGQISAVITREGLPPAEMDLIDLVRIK